MNALAVTFFRDRFATIKQEEQITLAALAERIGVGGNEECVTLSAGQSP